MDHSLGTRLRHLLHLLDRDVERCYRKCPALKTYRPRYTPVVRMLRGGGPVTIRDLSRSIGLSHSALSQTIAQMEREGWVTIKADADARSKIVSISPKLRRAFPLLETHWRATAEAAKTLDSEIGASLIDVAVSAISALEKASFADRIERALKTQEEAHGNA